ncbi:adenine phosphoribosyltransferase [Caminicella sporogenes DSM 14501]|uniref:Adenine phosphoribosyltransferase n=1 Tax=Caminicella sporogenes DSM 14501 TaxID=1121266 RepID=A0A1M6M0M9_9FIRM|nr:adenine phosphoribosyltransferase [Caminicella sporogenes]RKD28019.1 adenine phosphoribosyltransferase [Caminicella sporogenes]WIF94373.1 adenine phosphoribosyltransferase [Caminicella sporogenes]SHJ77031.1 adenine phosphoribosyltransferase [Caminicella sporogenes DSM 14501]
MNLKDKIRVIEDFPKEGISFKDITTLLQDGKAYKEAIDLCIKELEGKEFDIIVAPEARGFLVGAPLAYATNKGFVPVRKPGKLPYETIKYEYELEYGMDALEIHKDAVKSGQKVIIVDDLLATGGTTLSTIKLVEKLGAEVVGVLFLIELTFLDGRNTLKDYNVMSLIKY